MLKPSITTDQGSNMVSAVDLPSSGFIWMKCSLHFIHNAVKHALSQDDTFSELQKKLRAFLAHMERTNKGRDKFR